MSKITRVPRGLQEFLGTQNQGQNPTDLAQQVSPVLDMQRYYEIETDFWVGASFSPITTDTAFTIVTVPDNEIWTLKRSAVVCSWQPGFASGDSCRPGVTVTGMPNVQQITTSNIPLLSFGTVQAQDTETRVAQEASGIIWGGAELKAVILDLRLTAGSLGGLFYLNYNRLRF